MQCFYKPLMERRPFDSFVAHVVPDGLTPLPARGRLEDATVRRFGGNDDVSISGSSQGSRRNRQAL